MREKYIPPEYRKEAFHCPHCGVYSRQEWGGSPTFRKFDFKQNKMTTTPLLSKELTKLEVSICDHCGELTIWYNGRMRYPLTSIAPLPSDDMPEDLKDDFNEARDIVSISPRGAAALLRLVLQKLMKHLGEKGENLNEDIANLVKKGLPEKIQRALDSVRVIGNNAVHPGQIDVKDDKETAVMLFELVNMIVEVMITQPKKVYEIYNKLPEGTKRNIENRDKKSV